MIVSIELHCSLPSGEWIFIPGHLANIRMHLWNTCFTTDMSVQSVQRSATSSNYSTKHASAYLSSLHSVQQSCAITRSCACRVTSMSDVFFLLASFQYAKQKDVLVARFLFTNLMLNCHHALCPKHTNWIFIAAPASLRHKNVHLRNLHFWSRILRSVTLFASAVVILSLRFSFHLRFPLIVSKPWDFPLGLLGASAISLELLKPSDSSPLVAWVSGECPRRPTSHLPFP